MISILCPSRNRPKELDTSLKSLGLAKNGLEALVWLDTDDPKLNEYKKLFGSNTNIRLFIKERLGYLGFHKMMNYLANQAKYNWLFEFNDDAYMENPNWFEIFKDFVKQFDPINEPVVINIWGQGKIMNNLFPIVSKAYVDILGHFSLSPNCDDWIRIVAMGANISHNLKGIQPKHRKYGGENPLKDEIFYETERDRREVKKGWNEKRQILPKHLLNRDINKLIQYQNGHKIIYQAP